MGGDIGILPRLAEKIVPRRRISLDERCLQRPLLDYGPTVNSFVARPAGKGERERVQRHALPFAMPIACTAPAIADESMPPLSITPTASSSRTRHSTARRKISRKCSAYSSSRAYLMRAPRSNPNIGARGRRWQ